VKGSHWVITGNMGEVPFPTNRLSGNRNHTIWLDLTDLSKFRFSGGEDPRMCGNTSQWLDGRTITRRLQVGTTDTRDPAMIEKDSFFENTGCSFRLIVLPTRIGQVLLWLTCAPGSPEKLKQEVEERGMTLESSLIPTTGVKLSGQRTKSMEVMGTYLPADNITPSDKGWGMYPLIQCLDGSDMPLSTHIWKELCHRMRNVTGHNNRSNVEHFWRTSSPEQWPSETVFSISEEQLWPRYKAIVEASTSSANPGKLIVVSGLKYGMRGGYGKEFLSPRLGGDLATLLVNAANHSLCSSTWQNYSSTWKRLGKITRETGVSFSYPMSTLMVQTLVAHLMRSGLKSSTIRSYLSAIRQGHVIRGLDAPALSETVVKAALKGLGNIEVLRDDNPRAVMTLDLMRMARENLRDMRMSGERKRLIWTVLIFLFMGSLRASEILGTDPRKFDPTKTLCGADIKIIKVEAQDEELRVIQLRLKQPKTARTNPQQLVELPETGGWLCPVQALESWLRLRKGGMVGGRPAFTWKDGSIATLTDFNKILEALLGREKPKITTRAFRPALPTILAREGATESMLLSLGRWTSKSYLHYVRKGRTNDWKGLLLKLRKIAT
jgi:hypothetical protein